MPQFNVHIYPTFRLEVSVEAGTPAEAAIKAEECFRLSLGDREDSAAWGDSLLHFAEEWDDSVIVDTLDDSGEVQRSVIVDLEH